MDLDRVLFVCHGNICRSPMAEAVARQQWAGDGVDVASAGVGALVGEPMDPLAREALARAAIPGLASSAARQLVPPLTRGALVLTMTRRQRAVVAALSPESYPRLFTLREWAALRRSEGTSDVRQLHRSRAGVARAGAQLDIADPYGGAAEDFARALAEIREALR